MKRKTLFLLIAILAVTPVVAAAAGLVPCGGPGEPACQMCYFVTLMDKIIGWLVAILSVIVSIVIVVAGLKMVTSSGNVSAKEDAKRLVTNAIIGFIIVLAAWLLVDIIMRMLLTGEDGSIEDYGPWSTIQCTIQPMAGFVPGSLGMAGGGTLSEDCDIDALGNFDCTNQMAACIDAGGTVSPDVPDEFTESITCTYPPPPSTSTCTVPDSGACAPSNMDNFTPREEDAAIICFHESGGAPILSGVDICCGTDGSCAGDPAFSGGYFQINVLAHANKIPGCSLESFFEPNGTDTLQGDCIRRNSDGMCTGWSCSITPNAMYNTCMSVTNNSALNFDIAEQLYHAAGDTFRDWSWSSRACNIN